MNILAKPTVRWQQSLDDTLFIQFRRPPAFLLIVDIDLSIIGNVRSQNYLHAGIYLFKTFFSQMLEIFILLFPDIFISTRHMVHKLCILFIRKLSYLANRQILVSQVVTTNNFVDCIIAISCTVWIKVITSKQISSQYSTRYHSDYPAPILEFTCYISSDVSSSTIYAQISPHLKGSKKPKVLRFQQKGTNWWMMRYLLSINKIVSYLRLEGLSQYWIERFIYISESRGKSNDQTVKFFYPFNWILDSIEQLRSQRDTSAIGLNIGLGFHSKNRKANTHEGSS